MRIRLLFRFRLPSTQPKFTHVLLKKWPHRNSATPKQWHLWRPPGLQLLPKIKSDSGSGSGFSQILWLVSGSENKRRIQPEPTPDPWPPVWNTAKQIMARKTAGANAIVWSTTEHKEMRMRTCARHRGRSLALCSRVAACLGVWWCCRSRTAGKRRGHWTIELV